AVLRLAGLRLPGVRTIDIRGCLHRLHHRAGLAGCEDAALLRHLRKHQISELMLRVVSDADLDRTVGEVAHPLVALGVAQIGWNLAHEGSSIWGTILATQKPSAHARLAGAHERRLHG